MMKKEEKNKLEKNKKRHVATKNGGKPVKPKQITVCQKEYIDPISGKLVEMNVVTEKNVDFNLQKIWLGYLLNSLEIIGNKKIKVLNYLLSLKNSDNYIIGTQRAIAMGCSVSLPTVNETFKALYSVKAIKKVSTGVHILNPDVMIEGSNNKRMNVLLTFERVNELGNDK